MPAPRLPDSSCENARCPWCASPLRPVEVHGHIQCATCGINVDPCCGGAATYSA